MYSNILATNSYSYDYKNLLGENLTINYKEMFINEQRTINLNLLMLVAEFCRVLSVFQFSSKYSFNNHYQEM